MTEQQAMWIAIDAMIANNKAWKHLADSGDAGFWEAEEQAFYQLNEEAITALRQALEQADEPVAWMWYVNNGAGYVSRGIGFHQTDIPFAKHTPLYTRPKPAAWVGLTNVEIGTIAYNINPLDGITDFSRAIEAKLKEKNT